ncbi:hypothetical protein vseg_007514 [Gypsophila vaccaria]
MGIKEETGEWSFEEPKMREAFFQHFFNIYNPAVESEDFPAYNSRFGSFFSVNSRVLSEEDVLKLNKPFSSKEVRAAVFQMGAQKSPGPDGVPALLFQKYWALVKDDVTKMVLGALNSGKILKELNGTFITLIAKVENPEGVDNFRPISLCNVAMKIITKCLSNRLRDVMGKLVSDFQNAFVKGRNIGDNIMIAQEILQSINKHKRGKEARMALKFDMIKAYDRINWNFLKATLISMGFPAHWQSLIMECVTTVSYEVLLNGSPMKSLKPKCGLRQGDPPSP